MSKFFAARLPIKKTISLNQALMESIEEVGLRKTVKKLVDKIMDWEKVKDPVLRRSYKHLDVIFTVAELKMMVFHLISPYISIQVDEGDIAFLGGLPDGDEGEDDYGMGDFIGDHVPGADMGRDLGRAIENEGYFDWWWDANAELDDAFFDWVTETFDDPYEEEKYGDDLPEPSPPGDYNVPDSSDVAFA